MKRPDSSRRVGWILAAAGYAVIVLSLTLSPGEVSPRYWLSDCIVCGAVGMADTLKNIAFFVPLGLCLGLAGGGRWAWLLPAALLSLAVEGFQYFVPGRDANPGDLIFNTLGALAGLTAVRWGRIWTAPTGPWATVFLIAWTALLSLGLVGLGWMQQPSVPDGPYSQEWTPKPDTHAAYAGSVLNAYVGSVPVLDDDDPGFVDVPGYDVSVLASELANGAPTTLEVVIGPQSRDEVALLRIADPKKRRVFQIGAEGPDLTVGVRTRTSDALVFEHDQVIVGALAGLPPGVAVRIDVTRVGDRFCAAIQGVDKGCGQAPTPGSVWRALEPRLSSMLPPAALGPITLAVLSIPLGWWPVGLVLRVFMAGVWMSALLVVPALSRLGGPTTGELLAVLGGVGIGWALYALLGRRAGDRAAAASGWRA